MSDAELLAAFVALFEPLYDEEAPAACKQTTDISALERLYRRLPAKFPQLYEQLVLSYRWQKSDVREGFLLLPNPHGGDLTGLADAIFRDKGMYSEMLPSGFIQFGCRAAYDYDPICFHTGNCTSLDYPIVVLDHEEILCNWRIKIVDTIASSFREFVEAIVQGTQK